MTSNSLSQYTDLYQNVDNALYMLYVFKKASVTNSLFFCLLFFWFNLYIYLFNLIESLLLIISVHYTLCNVKSHDAECIDCIY